MCAILKIIPPNVDTSNPFTDDKLGRSAYAKKLMALIGNLAHPFVISLNSPWGTGKTFFIKRFEHMLKGNNFRTIYYNAWENDYSNDALISIMAEIDNAITDWGLESNNRETLTSLKDFVKKAAKNPIDLIVATAIHNIPIIPEEKINEMMKNYVDHEINNYKNIKNNIRDFTSNLENIIDNITTDKPLVFIIDELDRCRPDFAIEVLEKVKHLFNVKGLVFIICIDKEQISSSVSSLYGENYKKEGYLRKFFDFEITLPESNYSNYVTDVCNKYNFNDVVNRNNRRDIYDEFISNLSFLFQICSYPLRNIEQFLCKLVLIYESIREIKEMDLYILPVFLILKELDYNLYENFFSGGCTHKEITNFFIINNPKYQEYKEVYGSSFSIFLSTYSLILDSQLKENEKLKIIKDSETDSSLYHSQIWDISNRYYSSDAQRKLLKQKIDLISYFQGR